MTQKRSPGRGSQPAKRNRTTGLIVIGGIFAVALIALIIATVSSGDGGGDGDVAQTADVSISGTGLPQFIQSAGDPALGMTMPEVTGTDFTGNTVTIANDGRPKVLLFLAHW